MRGELVLFAGLVIFALISMLIYRLSSSGGGGSSDRTGRGGSFVLGFWVRNWFYWFIAPVSRLSLAWGLSPLFFNLLGVLFGLGSLVFFATGNLPAAGWMILLSGIADVMDGEIARARGLVSSCGAFLDSTLDRFSEFATFIGLAAYFRSGPFVLVVLIALGGSLLVSYTRARGESLGLTCKLGLMQRAERMLLLGFGAILDPSISIAAGREPGVVLQIILVLVAVGTLATSIYRTIWISKKLQEG
jgi:CDP-diacylglycerol--glycerol-3-phosphate 3-phosphatidyltransferase